MWHLKLFAFFILITPWNITAQSEDEKAIIKLVEDETKEFCNHSLADVVKKFWILDSQTIKFVSLEDGVHKVSTAEDMLTETEIPPPNHAVNTNTNYNIKVNGNMAFLTYDQIVNLETGHKIYSHEMRVLEKVDGLWKIHIASMHLFIPHG